MKLSEIKGERAIDVIAELIDPIANIAQDELFKGLFSKVELPKGADAKKYAAERLRKGAPAMLKAHKSDIISILATINNVPVKEYAENMSLASIFTAMMDLIDDEEFISFLSSQGNSPK